MTRFLLFFASLLCTCTLGAVPAITSLNPNSGPTAGGNNITIVGSGFTSTTAVQFGTEPATSFVVVNDSTIQAIAPIQVPSVVQIVVTANSENSSETYLSRYAYQGDSFAYFAEPINTSITVVDVLSDTIIDSITTSFSPANPAITPDGKTALISESFVVGVIDLVTNTSINDINMNCLYIAISPDGTRAYVSTIGNEIGVIDLSDYSTTTIPVGGLGIQTWGIAITPDGQKIYVTDFTTDLVYVVDVATQDVINTITVGTGPNSVGITPNGSWAYVSNESSDNVSVIDLADDTVIATISVGDLPRNVAITPDGQKVYVINQGPRNISVINVESNAVIATIPTGDNPTGVFITPDNLKGYVSNDDAFFTVFDVETDEVITTVAANATLGVVVAPDQAPLAFFTFNIDSQTNINFDASNSKSPVGQVVSYEWDFGDGQIEITTNSVISHSYAQPGTYTVTLVVTNSAGTSTTQVFTGQTVSRQGGPSATSSQTITFPVVPPTNFKGVFIKNKFATQTNFLHRLTWTSSSDPRVMFYIIYRNGKEIGRVSANGPFQFDDHLRRKNQKDTYTIIAVTADRLESIPISIVVP